MFDGEGEAYIRCFYIGLKTAVSIGKNPKPTFDKPSEIVFMGSLWIMGVFVFAVLMGKRTSPTVKSVKKCLWPIPSLPDLQGQTIFVDAIINSLLPTKFISDKNC